MAGFRYTQLNISHKLLMKTSCFSHKLLLICHLPLFSALNIRVVNASQNIS